MNITTPTKTELYKSFIEQFKTNPTLILNYVKKGCRRCQGKGAIEFKPIGSSKFFSSLCTCVSKNVFKEIEQIISKDHGQNIS